MFTFICAAVKEVHQAANNSAMLEIAARGAVRTHPHGSMQYGIGFITPKGANLIPNLEGVSVVSNGACASTGRVH
jgi:hypothetical protein